MCLIIYSPKGKLVDYEVFSSAAHDNPDGIGVMSTEGVHKFLGKKRIGRAYRVVTELADRGIPYGVHFRWTTHGLTNKANCHPFEAPSGAFVMHNGVIKATAALATGTQSDTALFVENFMHFTPSPRERGHLAQLSLFESAIGSGSKLLIMHTDGEFSIANEKAGLWVDGLWYSNDYSFPTGFFYDSDDYASRYKWTESTETCLSCGERLFVWEAEEGCICSECVKTFMQAEAAEREAEEREAQAYAEAFEGCGHEYGDRMCRV